LAQSDLTFPTLKPSQKGFKKIFHRTFKKIILGLPTLAHLGFAPPHKPTQKQTPKEPILPTRNKDVENNLTFFISNKNHLHIFDNIVKKLISRCKQKT
jgi:hypothetical protein